MGVQLYVFKHAPPTNTHGLLPQLQPRFVWQQYSSCSTIAADKDVSIFLWGEKTNIPLYN